MKHQRAIQARLFPLQVFLVLLTVIFSAEAGVMALLPVLLRPDVPAWIEAVVDACLLTVVVAPVLWWLIIRPLRSLALAEQARAAAIVATAADGIISIDQRGIIELYNTAAAQIFGYAPDEVIGHNVSMVMASPDNEQHDQYIARYLRTGERKAVGIRREVGGRHKDGRLIPMEIHISEVRLGDHRTFTGIIRDLTERKRYERQQREREVLRAEHMATIAQMATGVAHELRNPLTTVKMLVQGSRKQTAVALSPVDLDIIEQEIRRVERCVQGFLDYARPPKPERRLLDLRSLVERTFALIHSRSAQQGVALRFTTPPNPLQANADWEQIQQLLLNLALNALDMMPQGGELEVVLNLSADGQVEVQVLDTGPGIAPDLLPRLFEPFVTSKETGVGLGLVVSRRIAEDHGGTLTASNRPGGGACFVLRLPAPDVE